MTITEATIKHTLYHPEQLCDSSIVATAAAPLAAHSEAAPPVLDCRQFPPLLIRLSEVAGTRDDDVEMRFKVDNTTLSPLSGSMFNLLANNFSLLAKERIYYNLYNRSAAPIVDYRTFMSLWVIKPTVAHKILFNMAYPGRAIPLSIDEQKLNKDLGISDTVEKGLLPLPLAEQISREYQVLQEETHGFNLAVPVAGVDVETLHPLPGQFLVLTRIAADKGAAAANNVRIAIDRDYTSDYLEFPTWALPGLDGEIACFIPAVHELRIKLKATLADTINIRFTIKKCAMTNIFRARWGLATLDEIPGDTWSKVMAGVL